VFSVEKMESRISKRFQKSLKKDVFWAEKSKKQSKKHKKAYICVVV
jgi:hypothetical protein